MPCMLQAIHTGAFVILAKMRALQREERYSVIQSLNIYVLFCLKSYSFFYLHHYIFVALDIMLKNVRK
jgi:hypothetical protein